MSASPIFTTLNQPINLNRIAEWVAKLLQFKPSQLEILLFSRHLSTMIKAGIPIAEAFSILQEQTASTRMRAVVIQIRNDVNNGSSLEDALVKHPDVFDDFYIQLIAVSEASGSLDKNLDFITKQIEKNYQLKQKIKTAMLYPALIVFTTVLLGAGISFFVLPQLADFFVVLNVELPISTKILLFIAHLFKNNGLLILGFVFALPIVLRSIAKAKLTKPAWDKMLLHLPLYGNFLRATQLTQFCRNLSILIKSGVPITQAMEITGEAISHTQYQQTALELKTALTAGKSIAQVLNKRVRDEFPPLVTKMIEVGEKTGTLDDSFLYLSNFYEEEVDRFSKNLTTIIEPLLLVTIGLVVGFVAIAIITPIYELSGSIRG